ncbi:pyruvate, water dikinase regulatory protein [Anaerococcus porci]|uniref:pyruvate, water dikinase regulatory protein n=1 Tax=Anaerococcus porci TaxID=2652269 RepID=UPI002A75549E|nr:pyruvate, water dikinase regulatory protein [Anaerococcus porci]MDY3006936.1 pyruvate, water dikinase regulatory protein [Anaerococcus porci]
MTQAELKVYIISDSTGETAETFIKSVTTHFPKVNIKISRKSNIDTKEKIDELIEKIPENSIIVQTIAEKKLEEYTKDLAKEENIRVIDVLGPALSLFEEVTGQKALREKRLTRKLSDDYFSMIESIEFAVKYDDGKDKRGIKDADIVLLGVSRTSKTPVTMLLATKDYKVFNLPLVPEIRLPEELFDVDPKRIIGLTIDPDKLSLIREDRSKGLGIDAKSEYFEKDRINKELNYAKGVFEDLDCKVIDVTFNTIEQTATEVLDYYKKNFS